MSDTAEERALINRMRARRGQPPLPEPKPEPYTIEIPIPIQGAPADTILIDDTTSMANGNIWITDGTSGSSSTVTFTSAGNGGWADINGTVVSGGGSISEEELDAAVKRYFEKLEEQVSAPSKDKIIRYTDGTPWTPKKT